jgi:hypothetical protein
MQARLPSLDKDVTVMQARLPSLDKDVGHAQIRETLSIPDLVSMMNALSVLADEHEERMRASKLAARAFAIAKGRSRLVAAEAASTFDLALESARTAMAPGTATWQLPRAGCSYGSSSPRGFATCTPSLITFTNGAMALRADWYADQGGSGDSDAGALTLSRGDRLNLRS